MIAIAFLGLRTGSENVSGFGEKKIRSWGHGYRGSVDDRRGVLQHAQFVPQAEAGTELPRLQLQELLRRLSIVPSIGDPRVYWFRVNETVAFG